MEQKPELMSSFLRDVATLLKQRSLERVQNLLDDKELLPQVATPAGVALLQDLRRFTPQGLENFAEYAAQRLSPSPPAEE